MSFYDFRRAIALRRSDEPFYALIMAAMLKADLDNYTKLHSLFTDTAIELGHRYQSALTINGEVGALQSDFSKEVKENDQAN